MGADFSTSNKGEVEEDVLYVGGEIFKISMSDDPEPTRKNFFFGSKSVKESKAFLIKTIQKDVEVLRYAPDNFKDDKDVILEAVKKNGYSILHASERLKQDKDIIFEALKQSVGSIKFMNLKSLNLSDEFYLDLIDENPEVITIAPIHIKHNDSIILKLIKKNGFILRYLSLSYQNDRDIVKEALSQNGNYLKFASVSLRGDETLVKLAIQKNAECFKYASEKLKNNEEMIFEALKNDIESVEFASIQLKKQMNFVRKCLDYDQNLAYHLVSEHKSNPEFFEEVLKTFPFFLKFADPILQNDRDLVIKSLSIGKTKSWKIPNKLLENDVEIELLSKAYIPFNKLIFKDLKFQWSE